MRSICLVLMLLARAALAQELPRVVGPEETVFDWSRDACARWDAPDAPARAWRTETGVALIAGAEANRRATGPDLDHLEHGCAVVFRGSGRDDPAAYDDRGWVAATWAGDDGRVEALVHDEYHGNLRPDRCPAADYAACWRNAIVAAVSEDGGASFARAGLVAALPYRYDGAAGRRIGYFTPSNILRDGDYLYGFVFAEAYKAQRRGACLLRRPVAGGAADWRAWDGSGFGVRFVDPYAGPVADPAAHVCAPIPQLEGTVSDVVRKAETGEFLALMPLRRPGATGFYGSMSRDLVHWSAPRLVWAAPLLWARDCAAPSAYGYATLLDPASASPNFETVGASAWLYLVRMAVGPDCRIGPDRDLIRMRVSWPGPAAESAASPAGPPARRDPRP